MRFLWALDKHKLHSNQYKRKTDYIYHIKLMRFVMSYWYDCKEYAKKMVVHKQKSTVSKLFCLRCSPRFPSEHSCTCLSNRCWLFQQCVAVVTEMLKSQNPSTWGCKMCRVAECLHEGPHVQVLTSEARRDMRLRGLQGGEFSLSSWSFLRNSGGRRMSMGRDMRLLTSCKKTMDPNI